MQVRIGKSSVRLDIQRLSKQVKSSRQTTQLLPNLIHSLDATHLALILLAAKKNGISELGAIHDCLMCHPNDAARLSEVIRESFVQLYSSKPLAHWDEWMTLLGKLASFQLKTIENVLEALDKPNGRFEENLSALALDTLNALRKLDSSRRFLARELLDYLSKYKQSDESESDESESEPQKSSKSSQKKTKKENLEPIKHLELVNEKSLSRYFFC